MERYDLNAVPNASSEAAGVLRVANSVDEKDCGCVDAAITPSNLYNLLGCRKANTSYKVGDVVACPYHTEFLLKCTQAGTTSSSSLNTKSVTKGQVITDNTVKWTVIAKAIVDASISGKTITLTFIDGTTKTLTTQDTNTTYTAGTGLSLSSNKFSLASAYSNPITGASISGRTITLNKADGSKTTLTTQDTDTNTAFVPDYTASSTITFTSGQTYTVPYDCELYFAQVTNSYNGVIKLRLNNSTGTVVFTCGSATSTVISSDKAIFKKGTVLYCESYNVGGGWWANYITPLKGVN